MSCPSSSGAGGAAPAFPQSTANAPNLAEISYRIGDFLAFRDALLRSLPGEVELRDWRPSAEGDLALQLLEWWAYIGDVLAFYNERIANENYLRTAQLSESVNHLVQLLGYRPRPALGAKGQLAALLSPGTRQPAQVPAGLQVQSKPGPGAQPQVFEVDQSTAVSLPDLVLADVAPKPTDLRLVGPGKVLWLVGKVSGLKAGDRMLLVAAETLATQKLSNYCWIKLTAIAAANDPLGNPVTQVTFTEVSGALATGALAPDYVLVRPRQSSPLWTFAQGTTAMTDTSVSLAGLARGVAAGSLVLIDAVDGAGRRWNPFEVSSSSTAMASEQLAMPMSETLASHVEEFAPALFYPYYPTPVIAKTCSEAIGYPNGQTATPPLAIPYATIAFDSLGANFVSPPPGQVTVRWDWLPVGRLVPVLTAADYLYSPGATLVEDPASPHAFPAATTSVQLEDPAGLASSALLTGAAGAPGAPSSATLGPLNPPPAALASPLEVFFNLIAVSRGKTVPTEVLGSGDPRVAGQDFVLSKAPVTYFADPASVSGDGFSSTARISVNGVQWREVRSFYGQAPTAEVFVLREDDSGNSHVTFGDGINGARLPSGVGNVVATYRYGAGGAAPAAESLTTVLTPAPGLKGFRNPLPPTGGADADPPERLRTLAPRSVLTLNRVVSIDDFAIVAATAGGVTQAAASFAFDPLSQRPVATVWVAGDDGAVASALAALAGAGAPLRNVRVLAATPVPATLAVTYLRDPRYADADVLAALRAALIDPDAGLFPAHAPGIGVAVYDSQIAAACLAVPGVAAVQSIAFAPFHRRRFYDRRLVRAGPPSLRHAPGAGNYFTVPDDAQHLSLVGAAAP
jgi:hypothetical protein